MPNLNSIRVRLLSAFGFVIAILILAAAAATFGLEKSSHAVTSISGEKLPEATTAYELSVLNSELSAALGNLASAQTADDRAKHAGEFNSLMSATEVVLEQLATLAGEPTATQELSSARDAVAKIGADVDAGQSRFLTAQSQRTELLDAARVQRDAVLAEIETTIDSAAEENIELLLRVGLAANLIASAYSDAAFAVDAGSISAIEERYLDQVDEITVNFAILGDAAPEALRSVVASYIALGDGDTGVFGVRRDELAARASAEIAAEAAMAQLADATDAVNAYVDRVAGAVDFAASNAISESRTSLVMLIGLVGVGAISSVLIGWLYVSRVVVARIDDLGKVMKLVSDGDLEKSAKGLDAKDELGDMARALEVFRANAERVNRLNAEKLETERRAHEADERARKEKEASEKRAREEKEATDERTRREKEEADARMEAERRRMMGELRDSIGEVVLAAKRGDFSKRVNAKFADAELNELASDLNDLVRTVRDGLAETIDVLTALKNSDLTKRVAGDYQGAFGQLKDGVNFSADGLAEVVSQLQSSSRDVRDGLSNILRSMRDLSDQTSNQAATLEETTASLQQFQQTVDENAARAAEMLENTQNTERYAVDGGNVMTEATEAMGRISDTSRKITEITTLIDSIAFQTNLLALNASVEAARAGESGKGFSVVAAEVRTLAQSTANASREIGALIRTADTEIGSGVELVSKASERLEKIVQSVSTNVGLMGGVSESTRTQGDTLREINHAMRQLDDITQRNSALVDQNSTSVDRANDQFTSLDRLVAGFVLSGDVVTERDAA